MNTNNINTPACVVPFLKVLGQIMRMRKYHPTPYGYDIRLGSHTVLNVLLGRNPINTGSHVIQMRLNPERPNGGYLINYAWNFEHYPEPCPEVTEFIKENVFTCDLAPEEDILNDRAVMSMLLSIPYVSDSIRSHMHIHPVEWFGVSCYELEH